MTRKKILFILLLLFMAAILLHNLNLACRKKTATGDLEMALKPVVAALQVQRVLSFRSNNLSPEFFFRTEFVMAPVILEHRQDNDTVLYIQDLGIMQQVPDSNATVRYDTLLAHTTEHFIFLLLKRH